VTDIPMAPEPCGGALAHLAADPVPHPDLLGQIGGDEIFGLQTVKISEEYL
jgi:hypothetical protein